MALPKSVVNIIFKNLSSSLKSVVIYSFIPLPLWEGILVEGEIFKLLNLHPLPIPLPLRERKMILNLRNTCY